MNTNNELTAKDIKTLLFGVYKKLKKGELTEQRAYREAFILNSLMKAHEITEMEEQLSELKRITGR